MKSIGKRAAVAVCGLLLAMETACANSLQVSNVTVSKRDDHSAYVNFDIAWQNSWRLTNVNHDATWVFFKVRQEGGTEWLHVNLEGAGVNPPDYSTGAGTAIDLIVPSDGAGLFVRRAAQGWGALSATNVRAVWRIPPGTLVKSGKIHMQALAVEMVYVAEGAFKVGSGSADESGSFTEGSWTGGATLPFRITGEGALPIAPTAGCLWGTSSGGLNTIGEAGTLPAAFPKGFAAFYCMKYEVSQGQYADFLNTLTPAQAANRYYASSTDRYTLSVAGGVYSAAAPDWACNRLGYADGSAFMDWAGLRPRTELEFEKSCRGPLDPVANEFAWGTTAIGKATALYNDGTGLDATEGGNCNYDQPFGPYRVGIFATPSSTREQAGASYWGILDLSGSLWEFVVTVGNPAGRAFTGLHGDGKLTADGYADVEAWPGADAVGNGFRGCGYHDPSYLARVSDRSYCGNHADTSRSEVCGGRAARTAPAGVQP